MSTAVEYNGVTIKNCLTRSFTQEAVYDESQTDLLYHRFVVRVLGWVVYEPSFGTNHPVQTKIGRGLISHPADYYRETLSLALMSPRREFKMSLGDDVLMYVAPPDSTASPDMNNGPKPRRCEVTQITGTQIFRVEYEIELSRAPCATIYNVINNRWEMADDFDQNWNCTRTIRGRLRVRAAKFNPQDFRGLVTPPLQGGFKRESMRFATSRDGLTLDYQITDKRVKAAAPYPATSWSGTHAISTGDGVSIYAEVNVSITGPPKADKQELFQKVAQIIETKLLIQKENDDAEGYLLEQLALVDHLESNSVEGRARIRYNPSIKDIPKVPGYDPTKSKINNWFNLNMGQIGTPLSIPDYDLNESRLPTAADLPPLAAAFMCRLQSPCEATGHGVPQGTAPLEGDYGEREEGDADTQIDYTTGELGFYPDPLWSSEQHQSLYTHYRVESHYESKPMRVQLPIAKAYKEGEATSKVVNLGGAVAKRIISIEAERAGDWPRIPAMEDYADPTGPAKLLSNHVSTGEVRLTADSRTKLYSLSAKLTYALSRPPRPGEHHTVELPWVEGSEAEAVPADKYNVSVIS